MAAVSGREAALRQALLQRRFSALTLSKLSPHEVHQVVSCGFFFGAWKLPVVNPDISSVSSRGGLSAFLARHVRLATAGVFLHVEDRGPKHNAAREGLRLPQQNRMKYAG